MLIANSDSLNKRGTKREFCLRKNQLNPINIIIPGDPSLQLFLQPSLLNKRSL